MSLSSKAVTGSEEDAGGELTQAEEDRIFQKLTGLLRTPVGCLAFGREKGTQQVGGLSGLQPHWSLPPL